MTSLEQMQRLIEELGPATDEVLEVQQHGDTSWALVIDDTTAFYLDFVADRQVLILSTDLGTPEEDSRDSAYQIALLSNFNWSQSGGIKLGLEAPDGNLVLMFEVNAASLDLTTLQQALGFFAEKNLAWRTLIHTGLGFSSGSAPALGEEFSAVPLGGAIRV
ncbi:MAG: type III secretion system chaperone [Prosthecobacter sp.]